MKLFKKDIEVLDRIDDLEINLSRKIEAKASEREKRLEEMFFNAKAHKIVEYENQIKQLKSQIENKDTLIEQQQKEIERLQKKEAKNNVCSTRCRETKTSRV